MSRTKRHGFTLLEVLIALGILVIGGLGTLQLLDLMSRSNGNVSAEAEAMEIARELRAGLENIPLLRPNLVFPVWQIGPVVTAPLHPAIGPNAIGNSIAGPNGGRYNVSYQITGWTPPAGEGPDRDGDGNVDLSSLDIVITVDNPIANLNLATRPESRLLRPVIIAFRKDVQESASIASGGVLRW